ncbi:TonB-dependent receptor [Maricaulis sp.]|uniref:TonB-dependent receptor n=1 Tax=Maricaulis sp. TaxID=1486257 RepID=UPI003A958D7C
MTFKAHLLCAAAATATLAFAAGAQAQQSEAASAGSHVEVIRVTTQFREQSLADVPVNVAAFDAELLAALDIQDFEDLAAFTPGLIVQEQSPNNTGYSIRGITTDSGEATSETRVAVFQDGVSVTRSRGSYIELFDIERVEVAKGPQPTLFGRGALIGGINIIQNKADDEFSASAEIGVGNDGQREARGHVNFRLAEDYGLRFALVSRERDGYIDNVLGGRDLQGRDTWAARAVLSGQPNERFSFDLVANYQEDTPPGTSFKSGTFLVPGGDTNPFTPAALNSIAGFEGDRELGLERTVRGVTVLGTLDLNDAWTLSSITGWRDFDSVEIFDPEGSALPMVVLGEDATGEQASQEFRFSYDNGGQWTGSVGLLAFHETGTQRIPVGLNEAQIQALLAPTLAAGFGASVAELEGLLALNGFPGVQLANPYNPFPYSVAALLGQGQLVPLRDLYLEEGSNSGETTSYDIFADASYEVNDRLTLTAGLRWTREDKTSSGYGRNIAGPNFVTFADTLILPATPGGAEVSDSGEFDDFTWRFAASYALTDQANAWISYARGRRPDVISLDSSSATMFSTSPAEIVDSIEAGAFWTFGAGSVSGSIFYSEYENFQTTRFDPNQVSFVVDNAGSATQYGLELQGEYAFGDRISLYATYAYNSATFDDTDDAGNALELAGNTFRYAPEHSASFGLNVNLAEGDWGRVSFLPSYSWQSRIYFDNDNDRFGGILTQEAYGLLNARIRFETADERYHAEIYGSNLTDEDYLIDAGNTGGSFGIPTFIAGSPLLWGARIGMEF